MSSRRNAAQASTEQSSGAGGVLAFLKETALIVVGALIASTLLRMFLVQVFVIPSRSMENTLLVGDRVVAQKVIRFERGDVVVFTDELQWLGPPREVPQTWWQQGLTFVGLLPDESSQHLIKRVIGLPGDHVECCDVDGKIRVNGVALDEDSYLYVNPVTGERDAPSNYRFDVVVPAGRIFVLGDHRDHSADSRCYLDQSRDGIAGAPAFVRTEAVVGVAALVIFPFDRFGGLSRPTTFDHIPAPAQEPPREPVISGDVPHC